MPFTDLNFSLQNHVPPGGLGCFDATFTPLTGVLKVSVKVCPRLRFYKGTLETTMKEQYMKAFREKVPEYWNNRFQFKLLKEGFDGPPVKPQCEVVETELQDAHYDLILWPNASDDISICVRTGEDPQLEKLRNTTFYKPEFDPYAGKLSAQFTHVALELEDKSGMVLQALTKPLTIPVDLKPGSTKFSLTTMEMLRSHANCIGTCYKSWHKVPVITIKGPGTTGKAIAKDVSDILTAFGLKAKYKYEGNDPAAIVTISLDQKQLSNLTTEVTSGLYRIPEIGQYAVVHEYGHMLGLPDEYICYAQATVGMMTKKKVGLSSKSETELNLMATRVDKGVTEGQAKSQTGFMELCRSYQVPVPPLGSKNPSLMSAGHQFFPCHAVTLADALQKMTNKYTTAKDWRIDLVK